MPKSKSEYQRNEVVRCPNCSEMISIKELLNESFERGARNQAEMDSDTLQAEREKLEKEFRIEKNAEGEDEESWSDEFDKRWKITCSAHERTSSAGCICEELLDLNEEYQDIKSFISQTLKAEGEKLEKEFRIEKIRFCKQEIKDLANARRDERNTVLDEAIKFAEAESGKSGRKEILQKLKSLKNK